MKNKTVLELSDYDKYVLITVLEEEISRNCGEYIDVNTSCKSILNQIQGTK